MLDVKKILSAGRELAKHSVEAAERIGYKREGFGDGWGGGSNECVKIRGICIKRTNARGGMEDDLGIPCLVITGTEVNLSELDNNTSKNVEEKVNTIFKPLFEALEFEKAETFRRQVEEEKTENKKGEAERQAYNRRINDLLQSLD